MPKKTAKAILKAGAEYVISVKDNQPELYEDIKDTFLLKLNDKFDKSLKKATEVKFGHGRYERRTAYIEASEDVINWCNQSKKFGIKSFALVVKECEIKFNKIIENHYYICSKIFSPKEILNITSAQWGVETMHWSLDNTLGEDHSTIRSKTKIIASNIVRKFALSNIVNFLKSSNIKENIRAFMKKCSFNPEMLQI